MILIKFIAQTGVLSRRKSEAAIREGLVKINGHVIKDPTYEVSPDDTVLFNNKKVTVKNFTYILLNKPNGYLTAKSDPNGFPIVMDLLPQNMQSLDPVGRLDFNTSGALLLTDDGQFAHQLSHPKFNIKKTYMVIASRPIDEEIIKNLKKGIYLEDGMTQADRIIWNKKSPLHLTITLHGGKYRIIRRLLETFGIFVKKLHRIAFGPLLIRKMPLGVWRYLEKKEIDSLKQNFKTESKKTK